MLCIYIFKKWCITHGFYDCPWNRGSHWNVHMPQAIAKTILPTSHVKTKYSWLNLITIILVRVFPPENRVEKTYNSDSLEKGAITNVKKLLMLFTKDLKKKGLFKEKNILPIYILAKVWPVNVWPCVFTSAVWTLSSSNCRTGTRKRSPKRPSSISSDFNLPLETSNMLGFIHTV